MACFAQSTTVNLLLIKTIEAVIEKDGSVRLFEPIHLAAARRALVTILDDEPSLEPTETALLSEPSLQDWNRPEEDAAWAHLQQVP